MNMLNKVVVGRGGGETKGKSHEDIAREVRGGGRGGNIWVSIGGEGEGRIGGYNRQ